MDMDFEFSYCLNLCNQAFSDIMSRDNVEDINKRFRHQSSHTRSRLTYYDGRARQLHEVATQEERDVVKDAVRKTANHLDTEDASDNSSTDSSWRITTIARKRDKWVLRK